MTVKTKKKAPRPKPRLRAKDKSLSTSQQAYKLLRTHKHELRYILLIGGYALTWYFSPDTVVAIQDSALAGIDNTVGFAEALFTKLDKLLYAILGLGSLWTIWKHRKDSKEFKRRK